MQYYWNQIVTFLTGRGWMIEVFFVVLLTLLLHFFESVFYRRIHKALVTTENFWDDVLVRAVHRPLSILIWLLGISYAADIVGLKAPDVALFKAVTPIREIGLLILLVWFIVRFVNGSEKALLVRVRPGKKPLDKTTLHAVSQLINASAIITTILIGLQTFGFSIAGVVTFGGIGAAGIAFSAKDLLANFFGGLMVYLDRPFAVGEWIRSPDRDIEGTVEFIGWRLTRIRTFSKRLLYVPNSVFSTISVENPSRMSHRRIYEKIGLRYDDATKVAVILKDIEEMLKSHEDIDSHQTLMVNLIEFADSSLTFMVYTFTKTIVWAEFQAVQQDVFLKIIDIIHQHGAQCAFPTRTLHIPEGLQITQEEV